MHVNIAKCKQWGPTPSTSAVAPLGPCDGGVKVLGVPIGSVGFAQSECTTVLTKLQFCLERLKLLGCSFSAFHILRSCLSACKVTFLLRTLPLDLAERLAADAQAKMRSALNEVLDTSLDATQWSLARLPVRKGGLGILDPLTTVAPAHVASFLTSSSGAHASGLPQCRVTLSLSLPRSGDAGAL